MEAPPSKPLAKAADDYIAIGKNLLALLRDLVLVVLFLLLLLTPDFVGGRLAAAGFEEGDLMGFKWKRTATRFGSEVERLSQSLVDAQDLIKRQSAQLKENEKQLAALTSHNPSEGSGQLEALKAANQKVIQDASVGGESIVRALAKAAPVVDQAQSLASPGSQWAVVFSGNANLEGGQYEQGLVARKWQVEGADIYYRAGSYRVVKRTDNREEAVQIANTISSRYPDAYVVNFKTWCAKPTSKDNYYTC
ncbi:hypothetical protein OVA11_16905 [Caulobacter sp. SL161]|uniref:hypothetical protein n=1 Tax=Caulobacter sp. SL161 TaxID=2995156 RepID=UPI002276AF9F|nr:hypothetical protein [Caulobacter sp. SL161]MCY1648679.1 hypothetical protein [Caulobacter sp. SL161]